MILSSEIHFCTFRSNDIATIFQQMSPFNFFFAKWPNAAVNEVKKRNFTENFPKIHFTIYWTIRQWTKLVTVGQFVKKYIYKNVFEYWKNPIHNIACFKKPEYGFYRNLGWKSRKSHKICSTSENYFFIHLKWL